MSKDVYDKLQQLVFDENKVVSYKLLTQELKINVNVAKRHLQDFFDSHSKQLKGFYILIGKQNGDNKELIKISIVPASELADIKRTYISITSSHLYCIHKGELENKLALFSEDRKTLPPLELNQFSAIKNDRIVLQKKGDIIANSNVEAKVLQNKTKAASISKTDSKKIEEKPKEIQKNSSEHDKETPNEETNIKNSTKKDEKKVPVKTKSPDIFSLFQKKVNKKTNDQASEKESVTKKTPEKKEEKSEQKDEKNIKQLFAKQAEKNTSPITKSLSDDINKTTKILTNSQNAKENGSIKKNNRKVSKQKKRKSRGSDDESKSHQKKHRRIVEMDESESESEDEEMLDKAQRELVHCEPDLPTIIGNMSEEEDIIPPTQSTGKVKKWKEVTKTFTDENGYFVTKRTKEYVTDSEESDKEVSLKEKPLDNPKEIVNKASFTKKKQASLTSFFKQK